MKYRVSFLQVFQRLLESVGPPGLVGVYRQDLAEHGGAVGAQVHLGRDGDAGGYKLGLGVCNCELGSASVTEEDRSH